MRRIYQRDLFEKSILLKVSTIILSRELYLKIVSQLKHMQILRIKHTVDSSEETKLSPTPYADPKQELKYT